MPLRHSPTRMPCTVRLIPKERCTSFREYRGGAGPVVCHDIKAPWSGLVLACSRFTCHPRETHPSAARRMSRPVARPGRSKDRPVDRPNCGGSGENRTLDIRSANAVLFRLSYAPTIERCFPFVIELAEQAGLEPAISCVTGRRPGLLDHCSVLSVYACIRPACKHAGDENIILLFFFLQSIPTK